MSGGALLNAQGELIGVNGLLPYPILKEAYNYKDGDSPNSGEIANYQKLSFAVPIKTLVTVAPELAVIPTEWKTGKNIAEKVDRIAQQITVRIDNPTKVEGSGVIIAKDGNTYYVATACHVVVGNNQLCNREKLQQQFTTTPLTLVTPDGEKYPIALDKVVLLENSDAAIVKFSSSKTYQVAVIGDYNPSPFDDSVSFISGFPLLLKGERKFVGGYRFPQDKGLIAAFDHITLDISTTGYELVYTNLSERGMSGGAVLDAEGQLIGINGGAEPYFTGYALGVPIKILLAQSNNIGLPRDLLKVEKKEPAIVEETDIAVYQTHPSFQVIKLAPNAQGDDWVNYANKLWRLKYYDQAINELQNIISNPTFKDYHAQAYYIIGLIYYTQKKFPQSIDAYDRVITFTTDKDIRKQAYYGKTFPLWKLKEYEKALEAIDKAIKLSPDDDFKLYWLRGVVLYYSEKYPKAIEAFKKSIEIRPTIQAYILLGNTYSDTQDFENALLAYNQVISYYAEDTSLYKLRGFVYYQLNDMQNALADLGKAIELEPENPELYEQRAGLYFLFGLPHKVLDDWNEAIRLKPNQASYYISRGQIFETYLSNPEAAIKDYDKAIEIDPNNVSAYYTRSSCHILLGNQQQAIADVDRAIQLNSHFGAAYVRRGLIYEYQGNLDKALIDYNKAIELIDSVGLEPSIQYLWIGQIPPEDVRLLKLSSKQIDSSPFYASAYLRRGYALLRQGRKEEALLDYNKAVEINPDYDSYNSRGDYYKEINQIEKAKEDYEMSLNLLNKEIEKQPRNPFLYWQRGSLKTSLQDYTGAIQDYSKMIELQPKNFQAYLNRGLARLQSEDYQEAIKDFDQMIIVAPDNILANILAYQNRGRAYRLLNKHSEALKDYNKLIELQPDDPNHYVTRGLVYYYMKDYQAAAKDGEKAISLNPQDAGGYQLRSRAYSQLKNYPQALADANQVITVQPDKTNSYILRGWVYYNLKDYQAAAKDGEKAISLNPQDAGGYRLRGISLAQLKNYPQALADANQVITLLPDAANSYFVRGVVNHFQQNYPEALKDYELALSKDSKLTSALGNTAAIRYEQGDISAAEKLWQQSLEINPDNEYTLLGLGLIIYNQGDTEKGLAMVQKAIEKDKELADPEYLKLGFWGDRFIQDIQPILTQPTIQTILKK
jgi:tetratricopeptide (TPR) repeat protein/S1-C subfamily serine protease